MLIITIQGIDIASDWHRDATDSAHTPSECSKLPPRSTQSSSWLNCNRLEQWENHCWNWCVGTRPAS